MRLFVLALSLLFTCITQAKIVKLNRTLPYYANGEFEIATEGAVDFLYRLDGLKKQQGYGVFIYAIGDCSNYSELIAPKAINETGKIEKVENESDALQLTSSGSHHSSYGGRVSPNLLLFQLELRGKIFVLEETKNGKSTGVAVACGIHP